MFFRDVIGQEEIKQRLIQEVNEGRIPHAQLICGPEGVGKMPLAIAYARYISCTNRGETDACGMYCNVMERKVMKKSKGKKGNGGFSLVELIIVIAIMAVLVGVLAPQYLSYIHKAKVAADQANLKNYFTEIQLDYASTGVYNPQVPLVFSVTA